jgi:hypothetical protein
MKSIALLSSLTALFVAGMSGVAVAEDHASDVLASGYKLPKGFTSIQATEQPATKWQQIDALYTDPVSGGALRFTAVRGSKEMAEPGRHPIDVCIRDAKTGDVLLPPQQFSSKPLIEGCSASSEISEASKKRSGEVLQALDALTTVRFKDEYRPEYVAIVNQSMYIVSEGKMPTAFGGGVIIHNKNPQLPVPQGGGASDAEKGGAAKAPAAPAAP